MKGFFKKFWRALYSMQFAIVLLIVISILSIIGTVIPQGNSIGFYSENYGPLAFKLIDIFQLDTVYESWWFIIISIILSLSLILCSINRLPIMVKKIKQKPELDHNKTLHLIGEFQGETNIEILFKKLGFKNLGVLDEAEGEFYYSKKNSIGHLGSWFIHLGIFIIIVFYILGKHKGFETFIYGVPGTLQPIGDTPYWIDIVDFDIEFREDYTVDQYVSKIKITDNDGKFIKEGETKVNQPFRTKEMNVYQNGTGWALDVSLEKNGSPLSSKTLYQSEVYVDDNKNIGLQFVNFYPDYFNDNGRPMTLSPDLNNPQLLYALFYEGYRVDMGVVGIGEKINWEEYTFTIDNPQMFTLLQISNDPGTFGVALGGILLMIGVVLAFYLYPRELEVFVNKDGGYKVWAKATKNEGLFYEDIQTNLEKLEDGGD